MTASDSPETAPASRWQLALVAAVMLATIAASVATVLAGSSGRANAGSFSAGTSASALPHTPLLTDADVDAVLGQIDYVESSDSPTTRFDNAVARMVRSIDLPAFACATLEATPAVVWTDMGADQPRVVTGEEKDGLVAEQRTYWAKLRDSSGSNEEPLADLLGVRRYPPIAPVRNRADSLLEVTAQGLAPLALMFGARDNSVGWTWRVERVSIVGTDTADVAYSASVAPGAGWRFADPKARYTKRLRFAYSAEKGWRLSGWPNYPEVLAQFRANLVPREAVPCVDTWWGAL